MSGDSIVLKTFTDSNYKGTAEEYTLQNFQGMGFKDFPEGITSLYVAPGYNFIYKKGDGTEIPIFGNIPHLGDYCEGINEKPFQLKLDSNDNPTFAYAWFDKEHFRNFRYAATFDQIKKPEYLEGGFPTPSIIVRDKWTVKVVVSEPDKYGATDKTVYLRGRIDNFADTIIRFSGKVISHFENVTVEMIKDPVGFIKGPGLDTYSGDNRSYGTQVMVLFMITQMVVLTVNGRLIQIQTLKIIMIRLKYRDLYLKLNTVCLQILYITLQIHQYSMLVRI